VPIPENCARVHLNWTLGTEEIAVSTFHMQMQHGVGQPVDWDAISNKLAEKTYTKLNNAWSGQTSLLSPEVRLASVNVYHLAADTGRSLNKGTRMAPSGGTLIGSGGAGLPNEVALAVSLYGYGAGVFDPQRLRKQGRMYLPPLASSTLSVVGGQGGKLSTSAQSAINSVMGAFFNDMHKTTVDDSSFVLGGSDWWSLGVLSRKYGEFHRVERIRVGNVFDAQLRRRNRQREAYSETVIADS
jgi:hypothetical protein